MRAIENILARYSNAKGRQKVWESTLKEAYQIFMPERNIFDSKDEGQDKTEGLYDSTGIVAANSFVATMIRLIFPPETPFAKLSLGPAIAEEDRTEFQEIIDKVNEIHFNAVKASNFDIEIVPFLYDLFTGTGCMLVQKGDTFNPFVHKAIPITQIAFEENAYGKVDSIYRTWNIKEDEILALWPKGTYTQEGENGACPKEVEILENAFYDREEKKVKYVVINKAKKEFIFQCNLTFNPFNVGRWTNIAGEINGRGPGLQAVSEFRFLNKIKYFTSESMPFRTFPLITTTDDDVLDSAKFALQPGMINKVERNAGPNGPSVQAFQYGGDVKYEQYQIEDVRYNIKKLTLDDQMPAANGPTKTATEWLERAQEIRKDRTVAFSKIQKEVVRPVFIAQMHILYDLGALPKSFTEKFELSDINEFVLKMDIESPITKQAKYEEAQSAFSTLQAMLMLDEQATRTTFKTEEIFEDIGLALGIKAKYVRNAEERAHLKEQQAQAIAAMQDQDAGREVQKEALINASKH